MSGLKGANVKKTLEDLIPDGGSAIIYVLVYDNDPVPSHGNLHISGIAAVKVRKSDIGPSSAVGEFQRYISPYAPPGQDTGSPWQPKTVRLVPTNEPGSVPTIAPTPTGPVPTPTTAPACAIRIISVNVTGAPSKNNRTDYTVTWRTDTQATASTLEWDTQAGRYDNRVSVSGVQDGASWIYTTTVAGIQNNRTFYWRATSSLACGASDSRSGTATP
jgi:hypothetical protein